MNNGTRYCLLIPKRRNFKSDRLWDADFCFENIKVNCEISSIRRSLLVL